MVRGLWQAIAGITPQSSGFYIYPLVIIAEACWAQVVYRWAQGTKFGDLCLLTPVVEGSIVR